VANVGRVLYGLQLLDTELTEQRSKLRESEALLGESAELRAARNRLTKTKVDLSDCEKHLRALEMDLKKVEARIAKTKERLYGGQVTNPKELAGLEQDFTHSQQSRGRLEDSILSALVNQEDCDEAVNLAANRLDQIEGAWREQQTLVAERIDGLREGLAEVEERREEAAASVDQRSLAIYEELRGLKGGRAVALLTGGMCQGCRVTIPSGKVQQARKSTELVICSNCGRILNVQS
jgi:predicted  nucleic acid-binding Zn-ribbon protein